MKDGVMEVRRDDADEDVACGTCTACCHQAVMLLGWEDHAQYETTVAMAPNITDGSFPTYWLKRKPDGSCVYLNEQGCSIYDKRPKVCRAFNCVKWMQSIRAKQPRAAWRRRLREGGDLDRNMWKAAQERS